MRTQEYFLDEDIKDWLSTLPLYSCTICRTVQIFKDICIECEIKKEQKEDKENEEIK